MGSVWLLGNRRRRAALVVIAAVVAAAGISLEASPGSRAARQTAAAPAPLDSYSIVGGCYSLSSPAGAPIAATNGPFRMQAAALATYLLYTPNGGYLVDGGAGVLKSVSTPGTSAEWAVAGDGARGFTLSNVATGTSLPVTLTPASGCSTYPEAQVGATGPSFAGASPEATVLGTVEGHAHLTAFELFGGDWHCGRPWSPFGAPYALPASCAADEQGTNGAVEAFLDFGSATRPGPMNGWPTFKYWPSPTAVAEEGDYWTGIERAWKAGLRVLVSNNVDNEPLCQLMTTTSHACNDMASVRLQSADLYGLQNYIDAQSGGPGRGWFRIVTDPFQARRVINEGKLAVIQGIEVSRIFGCGEMNGVPQCNQAQVDAGLKEVHDLGVRTFFPVHEFNNAFGGSKGISGSTGLIINVGNRETTGSFFTLTPCPPSEQDAEQLTTPPTGALAGLVNGPLATMLHGSPLPTYGPGPQCNTQGLTPLGAYLIGQMIKQHFIIQLDHMDSKTATAALAIATAHHYAGVVSAHCCNSPQLFKQIYADGGFVNASKDDAAAFVNIEKLDLALADPRYPTGFGYGSDMNGVSQQVGPSVATPITYPFKSYLGNVTFGKEVWGNRTFDLNTDGLANYGMYADWLHDVQLVGGAPAMNAMFHGAEAYLEMWERADGVPSTSCLPARLRFSPTGLGRLLRLRESTTSALYSAGQPVARPGVTYQYCVSGASSRSAVTAGFDSRGRIEGILSTAHGYSAGGVAVGSTAQRLPHSAKKLSAHTWESKKLAHGARYLYFVYGGHVTKVAVLRGQPQIIVTVR
ncbi:MAG: Coagulation factor 5/8 type domain-containing protein [Solirubrobacteraceae bacterium]